MANIFKTLFPEKIVPHREYKLDPKETEIIIKKNRDTLSLVDNWIDEEAFKRSWFSYGVPDYIKKDIDKPINDSATYTDLIVYLSKKHFKKINYLEIGVSVGKNFFQLLNAHSDSTFSGFDIEELNPVIENRLIFKEKAEWQTPANSIKKTASSLKKFTYNGMDVDYLCADVWDENSWARLKDNKFNIIFFGQFCIENNNNVQTCPTVEPPPRFCVRPKMSVPHPTPFESGRQVPQRVHRIAGYAS